MLHIAAYICDALPAPKHQSIAWCSLFTFSLGKKAPRCIACLAQIAHRHVRLGASYCLGVRDALPSPRHQSIAWCSPFSLSGGKGTLGSTVCTQASLCQCTRLGRANASCRI